ncbi:MAG TPA: fatty acid desaturase, partial [Pseudomonadales bacterium]|nr:fatty acid desaturase [Pseudomonadales bacterium]
MWYQGLLEPSIWQLVLATLAMTHVTIVAVTVYLHRYSAHRSLEMHPALKHFFRLWLWLTTGMVTREWTAIHRKHHAMCETAEDPHSPQVYGLRKVLLEGAELYKAGKTPEVVEKYGKGCPEDWVERRVYAHSVLGVSVMMVIDLLLFGVAGLVVWAVQMLWIPFLAAGVINGIGHYFGYRNYECPDAATNIVPWGLLVGGEELHNNHHTYPNSAKLSQKWYEFDAGWAWISLFSLLGLAQVRSTGPVVARDPAKKVLDTDTAFALLNDRFRVMERYAREVVAPLVHAEKSRADAEVRHALGRIRKLMTREQSLVSEQEQQQLDLALEQAPLLRTVYDARLRLQEIWRKRGASMEARLEALRHWCADAEASGIQSLHDFAEELKSYTIPQKGA